MPIKVRKMPNKECYKVYNSDTKIVHAKCTTLKKAKAQKRLLESLDVRGGALPSPNGPSITIFAKWIKTHTGELTYLSQMDIQHEILQIIDFDDMNEPLNADWAHRKRLYERLFDEFIALNSERVNIRHP